MSDFIARMVRAWALPVLPMTLLAPMLPAAAAERPAVLEARAAVPALVYRSPFPAAPAVADPAALPWRDANDRVARIGGWKVYAREAQQAAGAAAPAASEPRR